MTQNHTGGKKISFQTMDMEVSLADIEYAYLRFICAETLRNSDDVIREQIRSLKIPGKLSFEEWRQQQAVSVASVTEPETISVTSVDLNGTSTVSDNGATAKAEMVNGAVTVEEPTAEPAKRKRGRKPASETGAPPAKRGRKLGSSNTAGRGRPPKSTAIATDVATEATQPAVTPVVEETSSTPAAVEAAETATAKSPRRRTGGGRKPSQVSESTTRPKQSRQAASPASTPARRTRGRAAKAES